jgi:hypothetical protein
VLLVFHDAFGLPIRLFRSAVVCPANNEVLSRLARADLWLTDIRPARDVIPALASSSSPRLVLVAGPPVNWAGMCGAQRGAVVGIVLFEGWASTPEEAWALCERGGVRFEPNHHHAAVGPMAGTISPSMPVFVVENRAFPGTRVFCRPADLAQQFGDFRNIADIQWWRDGVAPHLGTALRKMGGMSLNPLLQWAQEMGDESHNRNNALTALFAQEMGHLNSRLTVTRQSVRGDQS